MDRRGYPPPEAFGRGESQRRFNRKITGALHCLCHTQGTRLETVLNSAAEGEGEMTMDEYTERLIRLELLIGHLSDILSPASELVSGLRLQSNASVTTRGKLDGLTDLVGSVWNMLQAIKEELVEARAEGEGEIRA
jgi:hypothetical protein